ncbi:MAG TPA: DUF1345 domain-containing protein [Streptosporangiaceae bacterium]|nr:DUF1345 domain-containing protein [Streptosporangiaceae bacterium]
MASARDPSDMPQWLASWLWRQRRTRLAGSAVIGLAAGVLTAVFGSWIYAPAVGWDAMALAFISTVWLGVWPLSADSTAARATREDTSRTTSDVLTLGAAVASLAAVAIVLVRAHHSVGGERFGLATLGLLSIGVSWLTVHTIFTLRYALLYYTEPIGGIDFNVPELPAYKDFAYLAFTIGMTFQVSDTNLKSTPIRATALRHGLLSYVFGSLILAAAVNIVAGLG